MSTIAGTSAPTRNEQGFTLIELLISVSILMVISGMMVRGTLDTSRLSAQQANRSELHAGIRNATALLQQEVGQAGRVALPGIVTLDDAVTAVGDQWVEVDSTTSGSAVTGMFVGQRLIISRADVEEIVTVTEVKEPDEFRANFTASHSAGARVMPAGGFAEGIIPTTRTDGSTASVLKIVGDINGDGNLVYVEYTCDWTAGKMYRNMVPYNATSKPGLSVEQILLDNLQQNPPDPDGTNRPCFSYEQRTINGVTYVINVAIMTTVRTDELDPITRKYQTVTKALLNVAPRNVFHVWQIASLNYQNRIQPLPATVIGLLPPVAP